MFKVQKNNGQQEDFDRNKILNGLVKSGVMSEQAESVTAQVESWLQGTVVDGVAKSSDIRVKVLEILKTVNPVVAANFENYRKPSLV